MTAAHEVERSAAVLGGKYLTFALGRQEYGLGILKVREIIKLMEVTAVPRMPGHVRGVINLRGQVIGVVDLRAKFSMPPAAASDESCVIVVETPRDNAACRKLNVGIIVDRVCEVLNITDAHIEPPPAFDASLQTDFIIGMGKVGDGVKILLDIDKVLGIGADRNKPLI